MTLPIGCPDNWRDYVTDDERDITNRWSRWGSAVFGTRPCRAPRSSRPSGPPTTF